MTDDKLSILITAEVDASLVNKLTANRFYADVIPFIKTAIKHSKKVKDEIANLAALNTIVVFTSSNAVEAVHQQLQNNKVNWKIYCVGKATKSLIEKLFPDAAIVATAENAKALAQKIIANKIIREVYFFCGDKRRDELPSLLVLNNINVHEIEVYTTNILKHSVHKNYDGIIFFSPSAVEGFFNSNSIKEKTILFAIGNTTADEIRKYSNNKIVISNKPIKKELIQELIDYFN